MVDLTEIVKQTMDAYHREAGSWVDGLREDIARVEKAVEKHEQREEGVHQELKESLSTVKLKVDSLGERVNELHTSLTLTSFKLSLVITGIGVVSLAAWEWVRSHVGKLISKILG